VEPALATKNQDIQQDLSNNGLVYGIDLTKYKNQIDNREVQNELDDGPKGLGDYLGKFVQYIQEEQFLIVGVGIVLIADTHKLLRGHSVVRWKGNLFRRLWRCILVLSSSHYYPPNEGICLVDVWRYKPWEPSRQGMFDFRLCLQSDQAFCR
jgi:hypothetical protein